MPARSQFMDFNQFVNFCLLAIIEFGSKFIIQFGSNLILFYERRRSFFREILNTGWIMHMPSIIHSPASYEIDDAVATRRTITLLANRAICILSMAATEPAQKSDKPRIACSARADILHSTNKYLEYLCSNNNKYGVFRHAWIWNDACSVTLHNPFADSFCCCRCTVFSPTMQWSTRTWWSCDVSCHFERHT